MVTSFLATKSRTLTSSKLQMASNNHGPTPVSTPDAVPPLPIFSQAMISRGYVYVSGNIGCTHDLKVVEGGVQAQTRKALQNIGIVLKSAGSDLSKIVKTNIYLTNMARDFTPMNEVYSEFFEPGRMPARTCIGVAALPLGADVEIECVAEIPDA